MYIQLRACDGEKNVRGAGGFACQDILSLMNIDFIKLEPPYLVDLICTCGEECLKCMFCLVCMLITKVIIYSVHTKISLFFTYTVNPIYYLSYPFN